MGEDPSPPPLDPRARLLVRVAPVPAVLLGLALFFRGAPLPDVLLLSVVLGALPVLAVAQAVALRSVRIEKMPAYASTVVSILVLAGLCAGAGLWGRDREFLGLVGMAWRPLVLWSLGLTLAGLAILAVFRAFAGRFGLGEHPFLRRLLPRTALEKTAFVGVSLAAGVGEELVFRGYAIGALAPFLGVGGAVVLSTFSFGVVHAYQGLVGFFRTALLGGVLAWGFLASGSLLPAMVAHTALDLIAGIVLADRLMVPDPPSRV